MRWGYDNYGPFFLGGQVCNTRNPETNQHYGIRWRSSLRFVPCVPAESQAGGWNASVTVENSRGLTWNHSSALYPMFDWKLAMYELFPGKYDEGFVEFIFITFIPWEQMLCLFNIHTN